MAIKLSPAKPDDRYARMMFAFVTGNDGVKVEPRAEGTEDASCGWIEFWADDAKACKELLRRIAGRLYVLGERREKRKDELTDEKAASELEEYNKLIVEGLSLRTKAWRLVNSNGEAIDAPLTFENAKSVYGDEDHNLRNVAQDFLKDRTNFPLRASVAS